MKTPLTAIYIVIVSIQCLRSKDVNMIPRKVQLCSFYYVGPIFWPIDHVLGFVLTMSTIIDFSHTKSPNYKICKDKVILHNCCKPVSYSEPHSIRGRFSITVTISMSKKTFSLIHSYIITKFPISPE